MKHWQKGLTLVELMTTLAVGIVLMAVGIPLYQGIAANSKAVTQTNALVAALNLARSEAVKRAATVTVCAVADADAATPQCAGAADWENGWLVFVDSDGDGDTDVGETRLRVWPPFEPAPSITPDPAASRWIQFTANGSAAAQLKLEVEQAGTTGGSQVRCVHILTSGQIRSIRDTCS